MSVLSSAFRRLLLVRYCCLFASSSTSASSSLSCSLLPRHQRIVAGGVFRTGRSTGSKVAFQSSLPSLGVRRSQNFPTSGHNSCSISANTLLSREASATSLSPSIVPLVMSRRSSRASSIAAAAKISGTAEDEDKIDSTLSENEDTSTSKGNAVLKGSEGSNDEVESATKKKTTTKKKKKASPKKKKAATKKTKSKASAASDDEEDDDGSDSEKPKAATKKKKATPKKRKSKGSTAASESEDETSSTTSATKKKQKTKTKSSPAKKKATTATKKKSKAADHQRWTERTPLTRHWDSQKALAEEGSYTFTVISWNVAGLRAFVKKQPDALSNLAEKYNADVICLQETKLQDGHLDDKKLKLREYFTEKLPGYDSHWSYSLEKKGYSGTAMFIRKRGGEKKGSKKQATLGAFFKPAAGEDKGDATTTAKENAESIGDIPISHLQPINVDTELGLPAHDGEGRTITAEFPLFYLTNVYTPNSGQKLDRLTYRTGLWDADFLSKMQQLETEGDKPIIWLGDLNVAHNEKDTWNEGAKHLVKSAGTTPQERASFDTQLGAGYVDAFRHLHPEGRGHYSYWSQRAGNREPNKGLRLDYFICSKELMEEDGGDDDNGSGSSSKVCVRDSFICPDELGSDHCPIVLEMEIKK